MGILKDSVGNAKANKTVMLVLGIVIIVVVIAVIWKVYQGLKTGATAAGQLAGDAAAAKVVTNGDVGRLLFVKQVAEKCHYAIHGDGGWFKIPGVSDRVDEDEDLFINQLNTLTTAKEAAYVSQLYTTFWGSRDIKTDADKYLNGSERAQIVPLIYQNLS
jgi:hypothetical protein